MDVGRLGALELPDSSGASRRLGDAWAERPAVLIFLRHFGWLLCREHAAQVRERYDEIEEAGGDVVAVGTGDVRYAAAFVEDEKVPFAVVVDDDGAAARAAGLGRITARNLVSSLPGSRRAWSAGHRIHRTGRRPSQLGATFVVGPGDTVRYEHLDRHTADHAPLDEVIAAVRKAAGA